VKFTGWPWVVVVGDSPLLSDILNGNEGSENATESLIWRESVE
jgi:hypothetical protein